MLDAGCSQGLETFYCLGAACENMVPYHISNVALGVERTDFALVTGADTRYSLFIRKGSPSAAHDVGHAGRPCSHAVAITRGLRSVADEVSVV